VTAPPAPTLSTTCDAVLVAEGVARAWCDSQGAQGPAEARRELTAIAALSRALDDQASPELWRYRRRSSGLDVSLRVVREEVLGARLAVVVGAHGRKHRAGRGGR
jgi:hypothetical protein